MFHEYKEVLFIKQFICFLVRKIKMIKTHSSTITEALISAAIVMQR
jgi:hypothetical protein